MGEAAVKEPSMEDILSSIRKIISEEGEASAPAMEQSAPVVEAVLEPAPEPQMSDVLEEVRAHEPEPAQVVAQASTETSGNEAAKMAASLASIAATVKHETAYEQEATEVVEPVAPETSVWDDAVEPMPVAEQVMEEAVPVEHEEIPSLASIAETVTEQVQIPVAEQIDHIEVAEEPKIHHIEMAEATAAPVPEEAPQATMTSTVQAVVEEEMAFKGALMSPSADGAVSGAFDRLKRSAMDDVDAKTEVILRPMLREWLDENLPNMVERLVREEIERVARGV